jgi:hypothetical protein
VPVIAITATAANVSGIVGGILVFGDPLSGKPIMLVAECFAFALVLVATRLTPPAGGCPSRRRLWRPPPDAPPRGVATGHPLDRAAPHLASSCTIQPA